MSQTQAAPQITGTMFLFEKPELLTKDQHGGLGLKRADKPFGFCAAVRAIPLTVSEITTAGKHYPIVFSGAENPIPLAVVGLFEDVNVYVSESGEWEQEAYVPGYIRRYPFAFASEASGERLALVIDAAYAGIGEGGEFPLFDNDQMSTTTKNAVEFCRQYEQDRRATEGLMKQLQALNLIVGQSAQYTRPGATEPQVFAQYFGIDENALNNLADEKFIELRRANLLPVVYSQLMSMGNWRQVLSRRARRYKLEGDAILKPVRAN